MNKPVQFEINQKFVRRMRELPQEKEEVCLLITTDFPPYDGGRVGHSIRMSSLTDFLVEKGYTVYVLLVGNSMNRFDLAASRVSNSVNLNEHFSLTKEESNNLPFIRNLCSAFLLQKGIKFVLSSAPSIAAHVVGAHLKIAFEDRCVWIADQRDVASFHPFQRGKSEEDLARIRRLESSLLERADLVSCVSETMRGSVIDLVAAETGKDVESKTIVIANGYAAVAGAQAEASVTTFCAECRENERIIIGYAGTGSIMGPDQQGRNKDLTPIFEVFRKNQDLAAKYAIVIQGAVQLNTEYINSVGRYLRIQILKPVPNPVIRANLKHYDIGLNINLDKTQAPHIMGGKVYDYVASNLHVLAALPDNADALKQFAIKHPKKVTIGNIFLEDSLYSLLKNLPEKLNTGEALRFTTEEAQAYSRESQYKKLLFEINSLGQPN